MTALPALPAAADALLQPWPGPFGGLPPFDQAWPEALEQAFRAALEIKRAELRAIATNPEPPSFDNTLAALEDSGRALYRVQKVSGAMAQLASSGDMPAVAQRIAPLASALNDEIAHDAALFARVDAVWRGRATSGLNSEQLRLELGHGLHMLMGRSSYPGLGSLGVAWDFVELPALLNESWLPDPELLARHMRHHATGEPIPMCLVNAIQAAAKFDRIFSVNLDFLAPAIVDLKLHLAATGTKDGGQDGGEVDALAIERQTLAELGMPTAWDQIMRVTHNMHCFSASYSDGYAAGLYSYLWADVMAADVALAFAESTAGLYDAATAERYRDTLLSVGHRVPADEAFRNFRGRDPDAMALLRRFGLQATTARAATSP